MNNIANTYLFMDEVYTMLLDGTIDESMNRLFLELRKIKNNYSDQEWQDFSQKYCLLHPLKELLHQDPFTFYSYQKPRGYAGDAALLDYIYYYYNCSESTTPLGAKIFNLTTKIPATHSVRTRRDILAATIDEIAAKANKPPRILSIACGHLREAQKSVAVQQGDIGELIALDQDSLSITLLQKEQANNTIFPICNSVRNILSKKLTFNNLDFVYAAGLYDYLNDRVAARLTKIMFDMLSSGGTLLVANFTPETPDIGYMETFMQWKLIYRTPCQLKQVMNEIPLNTIAEQKLFCDQHGNVAYLKLIKN